MRADGSGKEGKTAVHFRNLSFAGIRGQAFSGAKFHCDPDYPCQGISLQVLCIPVCVCVCVCGCCWLLHGGAIFTMHCAVAAWSQDVDLQLAKHGIPRDWRFLGLGKDVKMKCENAAGTAVNVQPASCL